jgi:hypothetical protein
MMANKKFTGPIKPTGRGLERMAWWVIGTRTEAERQELRAGTDFSLETDLCSPNSCLEPRPENPTLWAPVQRLVRRIPIIERNMML